MKKYLQQKLNNEKGMTLIELLAVIVIIAIIAAIAIPAISNIIENSRFGAAKSDFQNAYAAATLYEADEGTLPADIGALEEYLDDEGTLQTLSFADTDEGITIAGTFEIGTETYTLPARTNSQLSAMSTSQFKTAVGIDGEDEEAPAE